MSYFSNEVRNASYVVEKYPSSVGHEPRIRTRSRKTVLMLDIEKEIMAIGGEYHIDCEEVLIKSGSKQENLYGGGYRVSTKEIEYMAMSNYKPALGRVTYEISGSLLRKKLEEFTKKYLEL